jgi:small subunit ribosomal protein S8e
MGITRNNLHKRRPSGAKRKIHRKKRKHELGRPPSNTKLAPQRIRLVRVRGGNYKVRGLRLNQGNYAWGSEGISHRTRILDVVYNPSNNELVRTKTLVKGSIVTIDATPFRTWYEQRYHESLSKVKSEEMSKEPNEKRMKKIEKRRQNHEIDPLLKEQFMTGKLLANLSSRPGQVGRADGYILEGPELAFYLRKIAAKKSKAK